MSFREQDYRTAHALVHNWAAEQGYTGLSADLVNLISEVAEAITRARVEGRLGHETLADTHFAD